MRVALFEPNWRSPISLLVCIVTRSPWSHAAFEIDGKWYDASESRGDFNEVDIEKTMKGRLAHVWRLHNRNAVRRFAEGHLGSPYDYKGTLGYFWTTGDKKRFYCFEAVAVAVQLVKNTDIQSVRLTGTILQQYLGTSHEIRRF